jgi:hypothetical protein
MNEECLNTLALFPRQLGRTKHAPVWFLENTRVWFG